MYFFFVSKLNIPESAAPLKFAFPAKHSLRRRWYDSPLSCSRSHLARVPIVSALDGQLTVQTAVLQVYCLTSLAGLNAVTALFYSVSYELHNVRDISPTLRHSLYSTSYLNRPSDTCCSCGISTKLCLICDNSSYRELLCLLRVYRTGGE